MKRIFLWLQVAFLFFVFCFLASGQKVSSSAARKSTVFSNDPAPEIREGERLFHANCGRCHNPPEDLSPREARAVVRQMRVRATLSEKDERALLKFLAP